MGATHDDTGSTNSVALHLLFLNPDGTGKRLAKIADGTGGGPTSKVNDFFGVSVASLGDFDGDGVIDLAVGASGDDTRGSNRGAVHVLFMDPDGTVSATESVSSDAPAFGVARSEAETVSISTTSRPTSEWKRSSYTECA